MPKNKSNKMKKKSEEYIYQTREFVIGTCDAGFWYKKLDLNKSIILLWTKIKLKFNMIELKQKKYSNQF